MIGRLIKFFMENKGNGKKMANKKLKLSAQPVKVMALQDAIPFNTRRNYSSM